jgi:dienelactone hydrolase
MPQDNALFYALRHPNASRRREAIVGVARNGLVEALPILEELAQQDSEGEVRELAQKAVRHLRKQKDAMLIDPLGLDEAERKLAQAVETYRERGADAASPLLVSALKLDPGLAEDPSAKQLSKALQKTEKNPLPEDRGWQKVRRRSRTQWTVVVVLALITGLLFFRSGVLDRYIRSVFVSDWQENLRREGETDYYLFVPDIPEPSSGWGMLVVLHDYSYDANSILPLFVRRAEEQGLILVAPTFANYPQPFSPETTSRLDAILIQVRNEYRTDEAGAVVFGYGVGGEIAMLYARDYFGIGAVATYGVGELYAPPSDDRVLPYLIMYGEFDSLMGMLQPELNDFEAYDNPTEIISIPDADKNLPEQAADLVVQLGVQLYQTR